MKIYHDLSQFPKTTIDGVEGFSRYTVFVFKCETKRPSIKGFLATVRMNLGQKWVP